MMNFIRAGPTFSKPVLLVTERVWKSFVLVHTQLLLKSVHFGHVHS